MNEPNYYIPPRGFTIPIGDGFTIYYYAIMIVCGIILATVVVALLFKRRSVVYSLSIASRRPSYMSIFFSNPMQPVNCNPMRKRLE